MAKLKESNKDLAKELKMVKEKLESQCEVSKKLWAYHKEVVS